MMTTTEPKTKRRPARTDAHRPGAIIPAHYSPVLCYSTAGADGTPAIGLDCRRDRAEYTVDRDGRPVLVREGECPGGGRCCLKALRETAKLEGRDVFGQTGKCGVCGAWFLYGEVWQHDPSGAFVHLGHNCSEKYELLMDRSAWELAFDRAKRATAIQIERAQKAEARAAFLAKHEGLEDALKADHRIIADIARRFVQYAELSEKQVALVMKLAAEVNAPKTEKPAEVNVPAPTGKVTFTGEVVSVKSVESDYGITTKITVKVTTEAGVWLAWGTAPSSLLRAETEAPLRGRKVEITATLEPGREPHFVFMKRPRGKIV